MMTQQLSMPVLPFAHGLSSIDHYIQAVHQIPMLTAEEELELSARYREHGDLDAARRMVMAHLRFVVHVARGYQGYGLAQADLVQEGNIGLMKAVKRFDPAVGVRLVSFAVHWIKAEIHEFILRNWRIVKVATTKAQRKLFFNLRRSKQRLGWMNADEVATVARELGVESSVVSEMEARLSGADIAFDAPLGGDDDNAFAPIDYLEASNADPARSAEASNWDAHNIDLLEEGIENLDARSQDIIRRRWLVESKATLQELADEYRVSAERIRQIEVQAMKKLRAQLSI